MKRNKSKKIISVVVALAMLASMFTLGAAAVFAADSVDEFAWNFSEFTVGYPFGENIAAETQNTVGKGQIFFANIGHKAFTTVHSAGAFGTNSESAGNIVADDLSTKWCQGVTASSAWFILDAGGSVKAPYYAIRGANDDMSYASTRVLHTWTVQGGDSASGPWTTISSPGAQGAGWTSNYQIRMFDFDSDAIPAEGFRYYRLQISRYGNTVGGTALGTSSNTMQFSYFGLVTGYDIVGSDEETNYLLPQVASGVSSSWAGNRATMNGPNVVTVNGKVADSDSAAIAAKSYTTIKSGLNVTVYPDTKFGYMFAPEGVTATIASNTYDYKYHGAHMSVDLKFSDGTRLKDIPDAIDQYGIGMNPTAQGEGKVLKTYQWNYVESELGKFAAGKVITDIILGFEMPDATPGHKAAGSFDDIKIFRDGRDYMQIEPADFVDIRQGANASGNATGALIPAVARPNPFQYWVPTTTARNDANKYAWTNTSMHGITTSKLASRHMGERLTFLFMANSTTTEYTNTNVNSAVNNSNANFTHDNEFAIYNYHYGVKFNDDDAKAPGVTLEVTPTTYGAVFRFTFPADSAARNVLLAAPHSTSNNYSRITNTTGNVFDGWCQNGANTNSSTTGNGSLRRNYLYGEFSAQPTFYSPAATSINTLASFPDLANGPDGSTVVEMRVATSFLSEGQAKKNFGMDMIGIDKDDDVSTWTVADGKWFEAVKTEAKTEWNRLLGSVKIEDPTANYWQLSNFYSKLARANLYPTLLAEYTGEGLQGGWQYASPYRGTNATPIAMDGYMIYNEGWWDTFKSKWPLLGFLRPTATADLTDGIIQHYIDQDGRGTSNGTPQAAVSNGHAVPRWINPGGNNMMTGTSSDAVISDMFTTYDINFDKVMEGYFSWLKSSAVVTPNAAYGGRTGLHEGIFKGYHPWGVSAPAGGGGQLDTTWSLEGYINDAAQVHMLRKMAAEVDVEAVIEGFSGAYWKDRWLEEVVYYENRAKNYVNHFDPSQPADYNGYEFTPGWFLNRNRDGSFRKQNPLNWGGGYTEDNAWPYRVLVPQDGRGLANLLGGAMNLPGPKALRIALDEGFNAEGISMDYVSGGTSSGTGGYGGWIHEAYEKREVKLGQFGMSNQTAYHMPWMYLHSDQPWKTQYTTRTALARAYSGEAIGYGYMGEEDNGAFASWYVWASLGLYPLDLGSGQLVISSPTFQKITITNDSGKKITINAPNNSFENLYIQSMKVNGEDYRKLYLEEDLLKQDLVIDYVMGPTPNETWFHEAPPSLTEGDGAPDILTDLTYEGIPLQNTAIPANQSGAVVSVTNIALTGNDSAYYLFDDMSSSTGNNSGQQMTKTTYDAKFTARSASVTYYDPAAPKVEMYTLTSSNTANADPKDWILSASNDGIEWIELDKRDDEIFNWRRYTRPFVIDEAKQGNYKYYKLDIIDASGAENLMLAELEFLADQYTHAAPAEVKIYGGYQSAAAEFSFNNTGDSYPAWAVTAVYDENSILAEAKANPVTAAAGEYTTLRFQIGELPDGYTAKAFLWDAENAPLCEAASYVSR
ncbi:MAG: glycoside hydrolase family 92 protein [Oscillospiraceae bacterium]|jgi:predicted alpha-1,2-mannosidase|nr:glycoside hydrolase family 92 protein [Oscillospiraceae bacterium]